MKAKTSKTLLMTVTVLLVFSYLAPYGLAANYSQSYQLLNKPGGSTYYRLNVTVQQSLYDYYLGKSHTLTSNNDFAKFVTPYALEPIADRLWGIYTDDEDFVNGVLMITHQIPYEVTAPSKYPVETIINNEGDCDLFSFIAASIIKAGGTDVLLLYYESKAHMNIGVSLSHAPNDARGQASYVTYNSTRYYVAECTGGNWQTGWRVGELPTDLEQAQVQVITLESSEPSSVGQVSASYNTLAASTMSLAASASYLIQEGTVTISGHLSPALQNATVVIYVETNSASWAVLGTTTTDSNGRFAYAWRAESAGVCFVRASWFGNENYAGADSPIQTVTILSTFFVLLLAMTAILVCAGIAVFLMSRRAGQRIEEPQPPEVPS
jgi:hypothetical protein